MFSLETIIESMKCNIKLNLNIKYPCSICRKPVLVNQKAIQCDTCNLWCHIKCDGTTLGHYNTLMLYENQIEYWNCLVCRLKFHIDIFPFTLLDNMEMLNMNNSDSTKFCKILPKFDVNCITSKFSNLNSYDIDANLPNNVNCKYYSVEEIHNMEAFNNLNIFHTNTNGLENKIDVLTELYPVCLHHLILLQYQKLLKWMKILNLMFPLRGMKYTVPLQIVVKVVSPYMLMIISII